MKSLFHQTDEKNRNHCKYCKYCKSSGNYVFVTLMNLLVFQNSKHFNSYLLARNDSLIFIKIFFKQDMKSNNITIVA